MEEESKEVIIRINRDLTYEEKHIVQELVNNYPRQTANVEINFF